MPSSDLTDIHRALGRIEGRLGGIEATQENHTERFDSLDKRLRSVERKAAVNGAVSGGIIALGVAFAKNILIGGN